MELGIYTFVERTPDPVTGETISAAQRLRNLVEEVELADRLGLDVFGIGEHHRPDYVVSTPAVVLAAAAERTTRMPPAASTRSAVLMINPWRPLESEPDARNQRRDPRFLTIMHGTAGPAPRYRAGAPIQPRVAD